MTVFIASIFLPHTVSFDDNEQSPTQSTKPPTVVLPELDARLLSKSSSLSSVLSIVAGATDASSVKTPGATTGLESIFVPGDVSDASAPHLLAKKSAPHKYIPSHRPDPLESQGWGKNRILNQPESQAQAVPSSSILQHEVTAKALPLSDLTKPQSRNNESSTKPSNIRFADRPYQIVPSTIGNSDLVVNLDAASMNGRLPDKTWVGTLGMPINVLSKEMRSDIDTRMAIDFESLVVWVDDDDFNSHYEHYCKTILWPHLHYLIPDHPKSKAYEDHSWSFYVKVNQAFANCISKNWKRGDIVWVQDYHLMLVPGMLRHKLKDASIGFFMHASFPSSEVFRCLPARKALIEGLLGANMLGFQIKEYVRHFLQTCSRILNVEITKTGVILKDGRFIHVSAFPVGIDVGALDAYRQTVEVKHCLQKISKTYEGSRLIIARDKLDKIHGVRHKLLAYERLLQHCPGFRRNVVLIQIATSAQEDPELEREVLNVVQRINDAYSNLTHQAIVFLRQDIERSKWLALVMLSECLVITSLREGMNLRGHEFVHCQDGTVVSDKHSPSAKHGPLILSEYTGAAKVLGSNALIVNPYDTNQCMRALKQALEMNAQEKASRWQALHDTVLSHGAVQWYDAYRTALDHAHQEHAVRDVTAVPRLSIVAIRKTYAGASKRLLILDYEGTLASWETMDDSMSVGTKSYPDVLDCLVEDKKNIVWIMSGRTTKELDAVFKDTNGIGLIAENGGYVRTAGGNEWTALCDVDHIEDWKEGLLQILSQYSDRIAGSSIEEFETSIVLRYDQAEDVESAFTKCGECANHINDLSRSQRVHAVPVDKGLRVTGIDVNKSWACEWVYQHLLEDSRASGTRMPDLLLAIGDSREDEYVFDWAREVKNRGVDEVVTVTVGSRNTTAQATIDQGVAGVVSALQKMVA